MSTSPSDISPDFVPFSCPPSKSPPNKRRQNKMTHTSYQINEKAIALCPAKEIDYDTIVLEQEATYRVSKTPMQLIKDACIANWSTYEGKRQAVIHHTNFRHK